MRRYNAPSAPRAQVKDALSSFLRSAGPRSNFVPYVSLDLETTGLDPEVDQIIEVAAIRFDANGVIESFHSMVNPERRLEYRISLLTGIDTGELARAPHFPTIAGDLERFIGLDPIVGQNPTFDTTFLERNGVQVFGPTYDTFDLASLMLPRLPQRSLGGIADYLGIAFEVRHRAYADAEAAMNVFVALRKKLAASHPEVLAEADRIAAASDWPLRHLFREVAEEHPHAPGDSDRPGFVHRFVKQPGPMPDPLMPSQRPVTVPIDEAPKILTSAAARDALEEFEERPQQSEMARAVAEALVESGQLIVEAGTGVGKSLAYLVPSALHAVRNNARTVISTNTINLQEQLTSQDIPIARRLLGEAGIDPNSLHVAQLKGRRNYLCLLRWSAAQRVASLTLEDARVLIRLLFWLGETDTGDRAELGLRREEDASWFRISAQDGGCMTMQCPYVRDGSCFLLRARRDAEAAHLLVVNHALLLSDVAAAGYVLPEYQHLVVDEAHHLEDEATRQFGFSASESDVLDWLDALHARAGRERELGFVATVNNATRTSQQAIGPAPQLNALARALSQATGRARGAVGPFFRELQAFGQNHAAQRGDYDERVMINRSTRVQPDWAQIESRWFEVDELLSAANGVVDEIIAMLAQVNPSDILDRDAVYAEANDLFTRGEELRNGISRIIGTDDRDAICWLTMARRDASPSLSSAPLNVAEKLNGGLFGARKSLVLTSATLSTDGHFDYIKNRLGLPDARTVMLGSPFDYRASTLLLMPSDMPEPQAPDYPAAVQSALIDAVRAGEGRALVLFTSHAALQAAYHGMKRPLEEQEILVLGQGIDGAPRQLLSTLKENPRVVVLGAASFWEGVDVTGDALSLLVIARLPFPVPSDPIYQARSELFDQPFEQYAVPQAILRFKQGFGRLIRRKSDRGAIVVLDRRLRSRSYGESFLRSLPACTTRELPMRDVAGEIAVWLARGSTAS